MGKKFNRFLLLVALVVFTGCLLIFMCKLSEFESVIWQSKATIAQMQPSIIIAEGQKNIDNAVAFQTYMVTLQNNFFSIVPWVVFVVYIVYKGKANERLQPVNSDTTAS